MRLRVLQGDAREVLGRMAADSVDACVTDPPYDLTSGNGRGFMGARWDGMGVAFDSALWREVARVMKPGAHLVSFGGTRTHHRMFCAIEDAGLSLKDTLFWIHGQGFPKSKNIGNGRGTALKPAVEPICLARKRLSEPNVAANVLRWGTGGLNIAVSRVGTNAGWSYPKGRGGKGWGGQEGLSQNLSEPMEATAGRWPSNLVLTHAEGCRRMGMRRVRADGHYPAKRGESGYQGGWDGQAGLVERHTDGERVEAFECVAGCAVAELDRQSGARRSAGLYPTTYSHSEGYGGGIGKVQGPLYEDTGGTSRFFPTFQVDQDDFVPFRYVAKADTAERNEGLYTFDPRRVEGMNHSPREHGEIRSGVDARNHHPTVKPLALCRWLITLITPPDGTILDPFMGSGSTGCAAAQLGFNFIGIEQDASYHEIAVARIRHWAGLFGQVETEETAE